MCIICHTSQNYSQSLALLSRSWSYVWCLNCLVLLWQTSFPPPPPETRNSSKLYTNANVTVVASACVTVWRADRNGIHAVRLLRSCSPRVHHNHPHSRRTNFSIKSRGASCVWVWVLLCLFGKQTTGRLGDYGTQKRQAGSNNLIYTLEQSQQCLWSQHLLPEWKVPMRRLRVQKLNEKTPTSALMTRT